MKIILVKPIKKLGKIGAVLSVKNGFGRNYLIPQKLAIRATKLNQQLIEQQRSELEDRDKKVKLDAENVNDIIKGKALIFIKQAADDGKLFGSVSNKEIAKTLSQVSSSPILPSNIGLDEQIKCTGVFTVEVKLHAELNTHVTVVVARSESEAQNYLRNNRVDIML